MTTRRETTSVARAASDAAVAIRPTLLSVAAFALNATPHEAAHAAVGYLLGFSSTLFHLWVNPDAATATVRQLVSIAAAGPIFSLAVGIVSWLLYNERFKQRPAGLIFLMLAVVGIYMFLGPLAGAAFGGDVNLVLRFLGASKIIQYAISATGLVLLAAFMVFMGRELSRWVPPSFGRAKVVLCTTVAPWLIGTLLVLLVYWPLPKFLIGSTIAGSVFWAFAVMGAALRPPMAAAPHPSLMLTRSDLIVTIAALTMVRMLVHGIRLGH
jgi:hypothetical protein